MGWLAPLFLGVGAVALAIPILVHLINRERAETVEFPSLMFLQKIPYRSMRRQKIRHWVLFLLRSLGLILLASAFARPFFENDNQITGVGVGGREMVILVDQSYSMGYQDRWTRAQTAARRVIDGLTDADRGSVILFSDEARAMGRPTADHAALKTAIDTAKVGARGTSYGPALKAAAAIVEESRLPRREVILISDFQKLGWKPDDGARLPAGTVLTPVDLSTTPTSNVAITSLSFQREFPQGREQVLMAARLINQGADAVRRLAVALDLNGRELQSRTVDLAPNSATSVTFVPFMLPAGSSRGSVRAAADALPADNTFNFELTQGQALAVLMVEPAGGTDRSLYLRRAFAVGDRPAIRIDVRRSNQVTRQDLASHALVVLDDAGIASPELARMLQEFVTNGGGLLVSLGDRSGPNGFSAEGRALLPAQPGTIVDRSSKLSRIDFTHPVFELFGTPRSGDFGSVRFFRYRKLELPGGQAGGRVDGQSASDTNRQTVQPSNRPVVLASFDDGSPALVERTIGKGKVLVWASTLDSYWSDLPVHAVYLPFVHQLAKHTSGYAEAAPWFTVGQSVDVMGGFGRQGEAVPTAELVAVSPSGGRVVLPAGTGARVLNLAEHGFYELRRPGQTVPLRVVASNLDPAESDLARIDPAELAAAVQTTGTAGVNAAGAPIRLAPEERERPQSLWWYLLVAAFVLLAAETVVGNQLSRGAAT